MKAPIENSELLAFAKIVDAKSLTRAAAELGIPRATIGKRLTRLERRLGVRLLRRTTRSVTLTDAGETFYRRARIVLDALDAAEASIRRPDGVVSGDLRVSLPPMTSPRFLDGTFFSNSAELLCRLAARGQGIAMVPAVAAASYLERAELKIVMPKILSVEGRMALVYPDRELVPLPVRAFIDWMATRLPPLFERA